LPRNCIVFQLCVYPCHIAKLITKKMTDANTVAANINANAGDTHMPQKLAQVF